MIDVDSQREEVSGESAFSGSIDTLYRIHLHLSLANKSSMYLDGPTWHKSLMVLYREIITVYNPKKEKEKEILDSINQARLTVNEKLEELETKQGRSKLDIRIETMSDELYKALQDLEITLRKAIDHKGMYIHKKSGHEGVM